MKEAIPDTLHVRIRWKGRSSCSGSHRASPGSWRPPLLFPLICSSVHTFGPLCRAPPTPKSGQMSQSLTSVFSACAPWKLSTHHLDARRVSRCASCCCGICCSAGRTAAPGSPHRDQRTPPCCTAGSRRKSRDNPDPRRPAWYEMNDEIQI